jgi:coniferyl-aldehyde dehydrogenase
MEATFTAMTNASRQLSMVSWDVRRDRLQRLHALLITNKDAILAAISQDFGFRNAKEIAFLELFTSCESIQHALSHTKTWMTPRARPTALWFLPGQNLIIPQPLGVVGIIVPWNYPLFLAIGPMVGAIAAGNRVMIKLSELSPAFGILFQSLVHQAFHEDEVRVILGDVDVAQQFSRLPFDHLLFTGSTHVGREVMRAASNNLTPVTLELGGKSPVIITSEARFKHAVTRILNGKLVNAGQTCIAPDYVLLPEGQEQAFIEVAREVVQNFYPELNTQGHPRQDYTSIISARHFLRLQSLLDDAQLHHGEVHALCASVPDSATRVFPPVLVTGVATNARIMQEEIFGPLLPIVTYQHLDDAIHFINARPRPLALYLFSDEQQTIDHVLSHTVSGGVTINDTLLHVAQENQPFGGVGASGMGAYHGKTGFTTFSHHKPVFKQHRFNAMGLFNPPYKKIVSTFLKWVLR